ATKAIQEHMKISDPYWKIPRVYSISILHFDVAKGNDYIYHGKTSVRGMNTGDILELDDRQLREFEQDHVHEYHPEYYYILVNRFNDLAKNTLDEWIYTLKNSKVKPEFKAQGIQEAAEILDVMKLEPQDRGEYNAYLDSLHDDASFYVSSFKKGKEEEQIKIAKNLLNMGLSVDDIAKATGLSPSEIDSLN
ncbi:MAG: hypothetical protein GY816_24450, partial [Cytophagales bacterium]|nr:hypothetical protein [Cytophagales bacterium]